jgi:hypothetical protein
MAGSKTIATFVLLIFLGASARAELKKIAGVSWWSVYSSTRPDGTPGCAMISRTPYGIGNMSIEYTKGAPTYELILAKPGWAVPKGTRGTIVMQFGYQPPFTFQTIGSGAKLRSEISMQQINAFLSGFNGAGRIDVTFTAGNEPRWEFATGGGGIVLPDFANCVHALNPRKPSPPTQPF